MSEQRHGADSTEASCVHIKGKGMGIEVSWVGTCSWGEGACRDLRVIAAAMT